MRDICEWDRLKASLMLQVSVQADHAVPQTLYIKKYYHVTIIYVNLLGHQDHVVVSCLRDVHTHRPIQPRRAIHLCNVPLGLGCRLA